MCIRDSSMLWHTQAGPVFAATMNQYQLIEAPNMQSNNRKYIMGGTPRIEFMQNGSIYSNLDDLNTDIICDTEKNGYRFTVCLLYTSIASGNSPSCFQFQR